MMYMLIVGNPVSGFTYTGVFETEQEANEYGERNYGAVEWWATPIHMVNIPVMARPYLPPTAPITISITPQTICACGHAWSQHAQNIHRIWVCNQCNCRGQTPPSSTASEIQNPD